MKKTISLVLSLVLLLSLFGCSNSKYSKYSKSFLDLFDTASSVTAYDISQSEFDKKYEELYAQIKKYSMLFDIYNSYDKLKNLKYINENACKSPIKVDAEIIELLTFGKDVYKQTKGLVNIAMGSVLSIWHYYREEGKSLPSRDILIDASKHTDIDDLIIDADKSTVYFKDSELKLDVGAIAKGYVCNKIYQFITDNDLWQSAVISLGGNIITVGNKPDNTDFIIGIENPNSSEYLDKVIANDKTSVVTSGSYQRYYTVGGKKYCHIIDKNTLFPADYFTSVTVICNNSALADAYSTALFCMNLSDGLQFAKDNDIEVIWMDNSGKITKTSGVNSAK